MTNLRHAIDERARQAAELKAGFRAEMAERLADGLLPWDGQWLAAEEIEREQRRARKRAWTTLGELLLLFAVMGAADFILYSLTQTLAY